MGGGPGRGGGGWVNTAQNFARKASYIPGGIGTLAGLLDAGISIYEGNYLEGGITAGTSVLNGLPGGKLAGTLILKGILGGKAGASGIAHAAVGLAAKKGGQKGAAGKIPQSCFVSGTLVLTKQGKKPIEEVEVGDLVLSYDHESGAWKSCPNLVQPIRWEI